MKEIWKDIVNEVYGNLFLGKYQVSNMGNVRAIARSFTNKRGRTYFYKEHLINQSFDKDGYKMVGLVGNNLKKYYVRVHRLVALSFVPNPDLQKFNFVNHKDENKSNNIFSNLEWCDCLYNNNYGTRNKRLSEAKYKHNYKAKIVQRFDKNGNFIDEFKSACEAARKLNFQQTCISNCCLGVAKSHKGFIFKYKNI